MSLLLSALIDTGATGGGSAPDTRTYKKWQDFYAADMATSGQMATQHATTVTQSQRSIDGVATDRRVDTQSGTTWTVPSGVSKIRITVLGGGGGGGRRGTHYYAGSGGGGAAFATAEYNVNAGETLTVRPGYGGAGYCRTFGSSNTQSGYNGNASYVQGTGSIGSSEINIEADYGRGGNGSGGSYAPFGTASNSTATGSRMVGGSDEKRDGGYGGQGSQDSAGWGPEGYGGGGGGSAGFKGVDGKRGGNGYSSAYGYTWGGGGGGGLGGRGGNGDGSRTTSSYYTWSGAGGGTGGGRPQGGDGIHNDSNPPSSNGEIDGGTGKFADCPAGGFTDPYAGDNSVSHGKGMSTASGSPSGDQFWPNGKDNWKRGCGANFGDGEATGGGGSSSTSSGLSSWSPYEQKFGIGSAGETGGWEAGKTSTVIGASMDGDMYNGVLGRLQSGGGASVTTRDQSNGNDMNATGCQGGTGAGGGAASGHTSNTATWKDKNECMEWVPGTMCFKLKGSITSDNNQMNYGGKGGNGGACGGGGSGTNYGIAGMGGIGAGGGGAGGHYNGNGYNGSGGDGGPGYILIEW